MENIRSPEFIASLESTKYPFVPFASLTNGSVRFLEGTFLDAHIYSTTGVGRYYISQVVVQSGKFIIYIGDLETPLRLVGSVSIPSENGIVQLRDIYGRPGGVLVSEPARVSLLSSWGIGTHSFTIEQTEFCVTCQVPIPDPGVSGIRLDDGTIFSGDIWIVGEDGVVLQTEEVTRKQLSETVQQITINVVGDPLYLQKLCSSEEVFTPVTPIKTIRVVNGSETYDCAPDDYGNFNIQMNNSLAADTALRIRTTPEGILLTVEGSTPNAAIN
jgi:hypothetical protein